MGLFDDLFGSDKKKGQQAFGLFTFMNEQQSNSNHSEYSEDELDSYGLDELQKNEVRKGNCDLWNFEEEELEDDDYYSDDD